MNFFLKKNQNILISIKKNVLGAGGSGEGGARLVAWGGRVRARELFLLWIKFKIKNKNNFFGEGEG